MQLGALDASRERIEELEEADTDTPSRSYRLRNREFHLAIDHMADSKMMTDLSEQMWHMSDFFIGTVGRARLQSAAVHDRNQDHDVIRTATRSQNADVARAAMQSHIVRTVEIFEARSRT